jgi:translation initiation factor IF-1
MQGKNKKKGEVIEALPSLQFLVQFPDEKVMRVYLGGKLHRNFIRVVVGDMVDVLIPDTGEIGRIVHRYK